MPTNILRWETIELEDFVIPYSGGADTDLDLRDNGTLYCIMRPTEHGYIKGVVNTKDRTLKVDEMWLGGQGSWSAYHNLVYPFQTSTGKAKFVILWENGNILLVTVDNGEMTERDIKLRELVF